MDKLIFDVETIPSTKSLSLIAEETLLAKIKREQEYAKEVDQEIVRRRLMATNPIYGEICVIGMKLNDNSPIALYGDEKQILTDFWKSIQDFKGVFVGFNSLRFDVPYIIMRTMMHRIPITNKNFLRKRRFTYQPHFDCYAMMTDWFDGGKTISLKMACDFFGIASSKEGEVMASNVAEYVANGKIHLVSEYCLRDIVATNDLYEILKEYV